MVATLSVTVTTSYGVLVYAFGVLLPAIESDLGWSRTEITGAFSLAVVVSAGASLAVGPLLDAYNPRLLMTAGAAAASLLVAAWSQVETLLELYLVFAGLGVAMATLLYDSVFTVVTQWFATGLRTAMTAVTLVGATASLIFSPLADLLETSLGWRQALLILALVLAVVTVPAHALVLRRPPANVCGDDEQDPSLSWVLRSRSFWLITAAFGVASFAGSGVTVHLVTVLLEGGMSTAFGALVAGLLGISQLPGRLVFGVVGRWLGVVAMPTLVFSLQSASLVLLALERTAWAAVLFAFAFGASFGMMPLLRGTLVADLWGRRSYGAISAATGTAPTLARAAAPVAVSALVVLAGGYSVILWVLALGTLVAGVGCSLAVRGARAETLRGVVTIQRAPPL